MAAFVFIRYTFEIPSIVRNWFKNPLFSKISLHASVLNMKFIHIGRINIITIKLFLSVEYLLNITASGNASKRQTTVTIRDISKLNRSGFALTGSAMAATYLKVNLPSEFVNPL